MAAREVHAIEAQDPRLTAHLAGAWAADGGLDVSATWHEPSDSDDRPPLPPWLQAARAGHGTQESMAGPPNYNFGDENPLTLFIGRKTRAALSRPQGRRFMRGAPAYAAPR